MLLLSEVQTPVWPLPPQPEPKLPQAAPALASASRRAPFCDDRHDLFSSRLPDPVAFLDARRTEISAPELRGGSRSRSTQAIVVLCSGVGQARQEPAVGHRWCSWADAKPMPRDKLVEEELARTHKEYCRLFQQHGGAPRAAKGEQQPSPMPTGEAPGGDGRPTVAPCRACYDPAQEHLLTVVRATRRLTKERIVFHYMHQNAPSTPALRDEGKLLLTVQDTNEHQNLSLGSVHEQLRAPAVYIFDCPHAGRLVSALDGMLAPDEDVVALGTCGALETLPWPGLGLPQDLLSACLMSPVRAALNFYRVRSASGILAEVVASAMRLVTARAQDRSTPLGELVSVFTAVADAIAWSCLPTGTFQRLFREDGALAELCRNFLLASRILNAFGLGAASRPALPPTHGHHMWSVWDSTMEAFLLRLSQQSALPPSPTSQGALAGRPPCPFFEEQMSAFAVWLRFQQPLGGPGARAPAEPPAELPVMLQCLLHPGCRLRALHLLTLFVDLGAWAVQLILLVGARPYLTKLLSHDDLQGPSEVPGLALVVWAKILVSDAGRVGLPGKDTYRAFYKLLQSPHISGYHRSLAALCLAVACTSRAAVKDGLVEAGLLELAADALQPSSELTLRWMMSLLCAEVCRDAEAVALKALHSPTAEALLSALADAAPEVRASAVYAIGCLLAASARGLAGVAQAAPVPAFLAPPAVGGTAGAASHGAGEEAMAASAPSSGSVPGVPAAFWSGGAFPSGASSVGASSVGGSVLEPLQALMGCSEKMPGDGRWLWLAQSTFGHYCREPTVGAPGGNEQILGISAITGYGSECTILNDASVLVRYELVCALAPWLCDSAASLPHSASFGSLAAAGLETDASVTPDHVDDFASGSSVSSCASTPTLSSMLPRSPHLRPNSFLSSVPVAAAHQQERRFMTLIAQDPMLLSLDVVRRFVPAHASTGGRGAHQAHGHGHGQGHGHGHDAACASEACDHPSHKKKGHVHDYRVSSVGIERDAEVEKSKLDGFIKWLMQEKGPDLFRSKGALAVQGLPNKFVFQAVHMQFGGRPQDPWAAGETRCCKMVFIGKNLDREELNRRFDACIAP